MPWNLDVSILEKRSRKLSIPFQLVILPGRLRIILFLVSGTVLSQEKHTNQENNLSQVDSIIINNSVDKVHAEDFGSLVIHDSGARMKPLHTF